MVRCAQRLKLVGTLNVYIYAPSPFRNRMGSDNLKGIGKVEMIMASAMALVTQSEMYDHAKASQHHGQPPVSVC